MKFLEESEADDPILSVVSLIDVFLVVIAALLVAIAQNPANPFTHDDVTIITWRSCRARAKRWCATRPAGRSAAATASRPA